MRSSLRFWLALSLLLVAGAIVVWFKGRPEKSSAAVDRAVAWSRPQSTEARVAALMTTPSVLAATGAKVTKPQRTKTLAEKYQVKNVDQEIEALTRVESAI